MATDRYAFAPTSLIVACDGQTLRVLLLLATYADFKTGRDAYPAIPTMAKLLDIGEAAVRRALHKGVKAKLLEPTIRHREDGGQTSTSYNCLWFQALPFLEGGESQKRQPPPAKSETQSFSENHPSDDHSRNIYAPKDLSQEDFKTKRSYEEARQAAQLIVKGWNDICPDLKPAYLPEMFIPGLIHDCRKRWNMKELGTIFSKARDSDYCAANGATILHALRYADRFFAGNYDDRDGE